MYIKFLDSIEEIVKNRFYKINEDVLKIRFVTFFIN